MKYSRLRGVKDVYGADSALWQSVIGAAYSVLKTHNYSLIITPTIEEISLFSRGIGEGSDIVMKEMYDFQDKKGRHIVLRPEGTASVVRAYIENSLPEKSDLFYIGQMFRYERPQAGRYREFFQIGVESYGDATPYKDADTIKTAAEIIKAIGVQGAELNINCLAAEPGYNEKLKNFLESVKSSLCEDCVKKLERAPIRVLDCKKEPCKKAVENAPLITSHLTQEAALHYAKVKELLGIAGVAYKESPSMVRGLDYYTGTVFEFITDKLGPQQNTILAGGRYDNLVEELGGKKTAATGFALGLERMAEVLKASGSAAVRQEIRAFIVTDKQYITEGYKLLCSLREQGISSDMNFEGKSFKSQFREAESKGSAHVVIIGENEAKSGKYSVKDMKTGEQKEMEKEELFKVLLG